MKATFYEKLREKRLIHGDLHHQHAYVHPSQGVLLTVIDWGDALIFSPLYDIVKVHMSSLRGDPVLLEEFATVYRSEGGALDANYQRDLLLLTLVHEFNPLYFLSKEENIPLNEFEFAQLAKRFWGIEL